MTKQESCSPINARVTIGVAAVFAGFASFYALLRSNDIFAVDGAHRCLAVYHRQTIFFHENNHMLYPVNVLIWTRLAAALGMKPSGPSEFYSLTELMNCIAAAASLAIVFLLVYLTVRSWRLALAAAVGLGFSKGFFLHATNASEPLVGLLWSLVAILVLVLGVRVKSSWPIFLSGLIFSLSMATYESMLFLAPAALVFIWQTRSQWAQAPISGGLQLQPAPVLSRPQVAAEAIFACGGFLGWLAIFGWAGWLKGATRPADMVKQFFQVQGAIAYRGGVPGKALNIPIGGIRNIYPVLMEYRGIRGLLSGSKTSLIIFLFVLAAFGTLLILWGIHLWRKRAALTARQRIGLLAGLTGLASTLVPPLIYDPNYDKLWLQPLTLLAFLIAIALDVSTPQGWKSSIIFRMAPALLVIGLLSNFPLVMSSHRANESVFFQDAYDLSRKVDRADFVVGDWSKVAVLYGDIWAPEGHVMDFAAQAGNYGEGVTALLREKIKNTERSGGRVYFLGLLDQSESEWNAYLGSRCGVPASDVEPYRNHSRIVATYEDGAATISLRLLDPSFAD